MHQMSLQEFDSSQEDFLEQMLSSLPPSSWPDLTAAIGGGHKSGDDDQIELEQQLRHHQINSGAGAGAMRSLLGGGMQFPPTGSGMSQMPAFRSLGSEVDDSVQALYNVFAGSLQGTAQASNQAQNLHIPQDGAMQAQSFGAASISAGGGNGGSAQPRQRVRARRGQATDPHSIAERLRRERIAERMKALQELVPNGNKTDKASMLDEIIDYVKFLQLQVKVLSMSRLGGAGVVAPLNANVDSERTSGGGVQTASTSTLTNNDSVTVTETQVAKLMEEDMGSAMQYLQGKGLCLMPISLATAISSVTGRNPIATTGHRSDGGGSSSPSLSGLTVQSATLANGNGDGSL